VAGYLETQLDRAAAARPNAGKLPPLHRLSRTEYQNAVRDLLALGPLPQEMDFSLLLPQDNASSGFDDLADLLFISPTAMESYLGAAEKISRLAIGDPAIPEMVNIYRMPDEKQQTSRVEELPVGTRGGLAIHSHGVVQNQWIPTTTGRDFQLPPILKPLQPVRSYINVLRGLSHRHADTFGDGTGDHPRS
jgi:hypothetical protein